MILNLTFLFIQIVESKTKYYSSESVTEYKGSAMEITFTLEIM